jgi:hypothetical protein
MRSDLHARDRSERPVPRVVRAPFTLPTWKRTVYALAALPLTIVGALLAVFGAGRRARELHVQASRALLRTDLGLRPVDHSGRRVLGHAVVSLPVHAGVALVTAYLWAVAAANIAYPLRPDTADLTNAWGGPTLAGAWAVHGTAGVVFLFATPWIVRGLTSVQVRLAARAL